MKSRMKHYNQYQSPQYDVLEDEREKAWTKLGPYEDSFQDLKNELSNKIDSNEVFLSHKETLFVLSTLSIVLGELRWRKYDQGPINRETVSQR